MTQFEKLAVSFVLAAALIPGFAAGQDDPIKIADVRLGFMGTLKLGYWSPLAVDVSCKGDSFQGFLEIQTPDSDGLQTYLVREAFAAPNQRNSIQHHVRIGKYDSDLMLTLIDKDGRTVARRRVDLDADTSVKLLNVDEQLIVYLGSPGGLLEATADPLKVDPERQTAIPMRIIEDLPRQWFDYSGVDAMVIATGDPTVFDNLDEAQKSALQTWVRQGGRLVVTAARNHQLLTESFLNKMLPARITGVSRIRQPDALESYTKSKERFNVGTQGLEVAEFADVKGSVFIRQGERPLALRGSYGLGTVSLIGFDVDEPPFSNWQGRVDFWIEYFNFLRLTSDSDQDMQNLARMQYSGVTDLATLLSTHLEDFPEVTVVPFGWVALLIFGYILLIGPIDYLFLKKVVGRLELTWITFPTWVIVISVAAYYAAHWLKGDALRVNRVEVVDVDQESETLRGTGFVSIFSPRIDKYTVSYTPSFAAAGEWHDLGMGLEQSPRTCSWMGVPESAIRGMMNQGSVGLFGRRGYAYAGQDVSAVTDVPIQVWSVKSLTGQWLGKSTKVFDSKVTARGVSLSGSLTNLLDVTLRDVFVAYRDQVYQIPEIAPRATVDLAAVRSRALTDFLGDRRIQELDEWQIRQGRTLNTDDLEAVMRTVLFTAKTPENYRNYPSNYLRNLDFSDRLDIGKVIVTAKIDAPGGTLWFNALPDGQQASAQPPEIGGVVKTNTYLRVLLDPSRDNQ